MPKLLVVYATRTGNTALIAKAVSEGAESAGAEVILKEACYVRIEDASPVDGLIVGSPTYYHDMIESVRGFLTALTPELMNNKIGAAFGSCGWNGEAVIKIGEALAALGALVIHPGLRIERRPTAEGLKECRDFGKTAVKKILERSSSWQQKKR
jgi:flavorubredoxin